METFLKRESTISPQACVYQKPFNIMLQKKNTQSLCWQTTASAHGPLPGEGACWVALLISAR